MILHFRDIHALLDRLYSFEVHRKLCSFVLLGLRKCLEEQKSIIGRFNWSACLLDIACTSFISKKENKRNIGTFFISENNFYLFVDLACSSFSESVHGFEYVSFDFV